MSQWQWKTIFCVPEEDTDKEYNDAGWLSLFDWLYDATTRGNIPLTTIHRFVAYLRNKRKFYPAFPPPTFATAQGEEIALEWHDDKKTENFIVSIRANNKEQAYNEYYADGKLISQHSESIKGRK